MQPSTTYKPSSDFALLLIGPPLSGKTNAALTFPDPYIFDADMKMKNATNRLAPGAKFWYDRGMVDDSGKPIAEADRWTHATRCLTAASVASEPRTIIVDSMTTLSTFLMDHILARSAGEKGQLKVAGEHVMNQSNWGPFAMLMTRLIMGLRSCGKLLVFTAHELPEVNEESGAIVKYVPLVPGQLRQKLGGMFTDVWRCEATEKYEGTPPKAVTKYTVRTTPKPLMTLGNSLGLPSDFVLSWDELQKYMTKTP